MSKRGRVEKLREKQWKSGKELLREVFAKYQYPVIVSAFSGGRDSLCSTLLTLDTLIEMNKPAKVFIAFVNTTNEMPETLKYARFMINKWFPENYKVDFIDLQCVELKPEVTFAQIMDKMFEKALEMVRRGKWEKGKMPCCGILKHKPVKKFVNDVKANVEVVGTRGEESQWRFHNIWHYGPVVRGHRSRSVKVMPLWDWSTQDVVNFLNKHPKNPPINPLYKTMSSTGCILCPIPFIFYPEQFAVEAPPHIFKAGLRAYLKAIKQTQLNFNNKEIDSPIIKLMRFLEKPRTRKEIEEAGFQFETVLYLVERQIIKSRFDWGVMDFVYYA